MNQDEIFLEDNSDLKNSTCYFSQYLGRRLYFHICSKFNSAVYDIRYFFKDEFGYLKPYVVGIQLSEQEFFQICNKC